MLEESSDDRPDSYIVSEPWNSGFNAAKPTNDQFHTHTCDRGLNELGDHLSIFELIHFQDDSRRESLFGVGYFPIDQIDQFRSHIHWRDQQAVVFFFRRATG